MQIDLATHRTLADVRQFLKATSLSRTEAYAPVGRTRRRFAYWKLGKRAERGLLRPCLHRTTGLSAGAGGAADRGVHVFSNGD